MKIKKANTEILFESLNNGEAFNGRNGRRLLGTYIGSVEVVVDQTWDYWNGPDDVTEYYLAIKLPTGEILGVENDNNVFSLAGRDFIIHWDEYPIGFPDELKTEMKCPETLERYSNSNAKIYAPCQVEYSDVDELPF